jgi:UDP-N-acetylglucosamine acyltransferase
MILEGHPSRVRGVNVIGLQRGGYSEDSIESLRQAFRRIYRSGNPRRHTLEELKSEMADSALVTNLVRSLEETEIGAKGRYRESLREQFLRIGSERIGTATAGR